MTKGVEDFDCLHLPVKLVIYQKNSVREKQPPDQSHLHISISRNQSSSWKNITSCKISFHICRAVGLPQQLIWLKRSTRFDCLAFTVHLNNQKTTEAFFIGHSKNQRVVIINSYPQKHMIIHQVMISQRLCWTNQSQEVVSHTKRQAQLSTLMEMLLLLLPVDSTSSYLTVFLIGE